MTERRLTTTETALDIMGKAHALLETISESAQDDEPRKKLMGGYLLATELRGLSMSSTFVLFWVACGALGGPVLGLAGWWLRHCTAWRDALAVAALAGLLLGEAVYGLSLLSATTGATYWVLQTVVSVALLVGWAVRRRPDTRWLALAIVGTAAGAGSFALVWVSLSISASV